MEWLAIHAFVVAIWAVIFWGTIRVVDKHNLKNHFGYAVAIGVIYSLSNISGLPGIVYVIAWLGLLLRILIWHYNLNVLGAIVVTASTIFTPYFLVPQLVKFIGGSVTRFYLVLYGLPVAVFGVWLVQRYRNRNGRSSDATVDGAIPQARVEKGGRKKAKLEPAAPIVVAPPAPVVAPPKQDPDAPRGDRPTFLT